MRKKHRFLAGMLTVTLLFSWVPCEVFAQTTGKKVSTMGEINTGQATETPAETNTEQAKERIGINTATPSDTIRHKKVDVKAEKVPISTMSIYKDMDYSFLKTFPFGTTYKDEIHLKIKTVEKLKESEDCRLKEGNVVQTEGFYTEHDGGAGTYKIIGEGSYNTIPLKNGLFAQLIPDTTMIDGKKWAVVNPKQLGAKGDGSQGEQGILTESFHLAGDAVQQQEDIFRAIVFLPKGEYKCTRQLYFSVKDINIVGEGDDTIIYTNNDYTDWYEFFMWSNNSHNLYLGEFKIEARERDMQQYYRQLAFVDSSNMYLYKVNMNIPQEAFSMNYYVDKQYTNLTFYAGNKDMTVDSCKMELMCSTYRGANLGVLDFYCRGEENITVMNCELYDNARDEQIGIFTGVTDRDSSFIKNVYFINNEVHTYSPLDENAAGGHRTMCFTVAYNQSKNIDNIRIAGNRFSSQVDSKFITFGNVDNCIVENNIFELECTKHLGSYIFEVGALDYGDLIVRNNEFYVTGDGKAAVCSGPVALTNNRMVFDTAGFGHIIYREGTMENNDVVCFNGGLSDLLNYANVCKGNTIETYSGFSGFAKGPYGPMVYIDDNIVYNYQRAFNYEYETTFTSLGTLGGTEIQEVSVKGNQYYRPNQCIVKGKTDDTPIPIGLFYCRSFKEGKIVAKNNIFQQVRNNKVYDCDMTGRFEFGEDNKVLDYNPFLPKEELYTEVNILQNGEKVTEIYTTEDTVKLSTNITNGARWYSAINAKASVDLNGTVVRKDYGDVVIYCAPTDGSYKAEYNEEGQETGQKPLIAKCVVHFQKAKAEKITVSHEEVKLKVGKKKHIMYEVAPKDQVSQDLLWTSSNSDVATVSQSGIITAVALGEAVITAKTKDGSNLSVSIPVTVEPTMVYKVSLNNQVWDGGDLPLENGIRFSKGVAVGSTLQLKASFAPADATNTGISKWVSTNEAVATVDKNGLVKAVGPGVAQVIAYSMDGNYSASCGVYVQLEPVKNMKMNVGQTYVDLEWDAVEGVDGYRIYKYDEATKMYTQLDWGTTKNYCGIGQLTPDTDYKYMVTAYIKRRDQNGYDHYYENRQTVVEFHTYKDKVITTFGYTEDKKLCMEEGERIKFELENGAYTYHVEDESIAKMEVKVESHKNTFYITGVKKGKTYFVLTGADSKKYTAKIPILVTNFGEVVLDLQGAPKAIDFKWEYADNDVDGFVIIRNWIWADEGIKLPITEVNKITEDGKTKYTYQLTGLEAGKEYSVTVKPYITVEDVDFAGTGTTGKATTVDVVNVSGITTKDVVEVKEGEDVTLEVMVTPENATYKKLQISLYDESIAKIKNVTNDGAKTIIVITGIKKGSTALDLVATDSGNFTKVVTVNVTSTDKPTGTKNPTGTDKPVETKAPTGTSNPAGTKTPTGTANPAETKIPTGTKTPAETKKPTETKTPIETTNPTETDKPGEDNGISAPGSLKQVKAYTSKIKLQWKVPSGIDGVEIYMYKNKQWKCIANKASGVTTHTVKKLSAGTTYRFKIRCYVNKDGQTLYSKYLSRKAVTSPKKVAKVSVTMKNKKLTVKWKKQKCDGYEISYSTSKTFKKAKKVLVKKANAKKKVIKSSAFKGNKTYYVRVRAYKCVGNKKYYGTYSVVKKVVGK